MMTVFAAKKEDFEKLQALYYEHSAWLEKIAPDYFRAAYHDEALFTGIVEFKSSDILVAEEEGVPVGMLTVWTSQRPLSPHINPRKYACISNFTFASETARDALLSAARVWAGEHGLRHIQISLHTNDVDNRKFYTGMGFTPEIATYTLEILSPNEE